MNTRTAEGQRDEREANTVSCVSFSADFSATADNFVNLQYIDFASILKCAFSTSKMFI